VLTGSFGSGGGGFRAVLTEQNRQPLVQVSPSNYQKTMLINFKLKLKKSNLN